MIPNHDFVDRGLLIVTGSNLQAEREDRPLAYLLKRQTEEILGYDADDGGVVVISDLWYLNAEALHSLPVISIGNPNTNALAAFLFKRLAKVVVVDETLTIQMDLHMADLRASIWGNDYESTAIAVDIFTSKGYHKHFLEAAVESQY